MVNVRLAAGVSTSVPARAIATVPSSATLTVWGLAVTGLEGEAVAAVVVGAGRVGVGAVGVQGQLSLQRPGHEAVGQRVVLRVGSRERAADRGVLSRGNAAVGRCRGGVAAAEVA